MTRAQTPAAAEAYHQYLRAVREGDRRSAFDVVARAREQGLEMEAIYHDVLQPVLREIGRLWQENEISVADEHLATAITQAAMARLYQETFAAGDGGGPTLIAACADLERHEIGLRMLCDLLEMEGWETVYLGATVPTGDLVRMVVDRKPDVVALSVAIAPHLPRLREMIRAIRDATAGAPPLILAGGRPFHAHPDLAERLGADLTAESARDAVALLRERVPSTPAPRRPA